MQWISHAAPVASGLSAAGVARSIARAIAFGESTPDAALFAHAQAIEGNDSAVGKVHAAGTWRGPAVHTQLAAALGAPLGRALQADFEWYYCRGAFFHNDAHYDAQLFGVWCISGPPIELVFPRAAVRVAAGSGTLVVFDPFEIHGVLAPGHSTYAAADYQGADASVFLGFELGITPAIAEAFGIRSGVSGHLISSRTRISAASGTIESFD
jgi:hypothetical protein